MYLVPQPFAGNDGDFVTYALVGLEVEGELWVVALNDDLGGLLDGLWCVVLSVTARRSQRRGCSKSLPAYVVDTGRGVEQLTFVRTRPMIAVVLEVVGGGWRWMWLKSASRTLVCEVWGLALKSRITCKSPSPNKITLWTNCIHNPPGHGCIVLKGCRRRNRCCIRI